MSDAPQAPSSAPPPGWYPDPGGTAQWRRWEGTTWGQATMPFGPAPPEPWTLLRARVAWQRLHPIAPWAIAAPAVGAALVAAQSSTYASLRAWVRAYVSAEIHSRPLPVMPTAIGTSPLVVTITHTVALVATLLGVFAWLGFCAASIRVARSAGCPQHHGPVTTCLAFFVPLVGPVVSWLASRACLPAHESRRPLGRGWLLVGLGQALSIGTYVAVLTTPSMVVAWVVASCCAVTWLAAAFALPVGLEAIADDQASFGVRLGASPS